MSAVFRIEMEGSTAIWTVDRPHARNAIDEDVVGGFEAALARAESDASLRAVVLTGAGDAAFSAGADLKFLHTAKKEVRAELDARMTKVLDRIEALPIPVIAALNGVAMGGGAEVATACDVRIAEPDAAIAFRHAAMGVTPGWGGLARLATLVGRGGVSKVLFSAEPVRPDEAVRIGLVDELVEYAGSKARALELANAIGQTSPGAIADIKRLIWLTYRQGPEAVRTEEQRTFKSRVDSDDHSEALEAYHERRAPVFKTRPSH